MVASLKVPDLTTAGRATATTLSAAATDAPMTSLFLFRGFFRKATIFGGQKGFGTEAPKRDER
jgi:hypothetical protein